MQRIFVQLESARVDFAAREEVDRAFLVLDFNELVVAHQEASLGQFENVFHIAHRADELARRYIAIGFFGYRCSLDLFRDTSFA